MLNLKVAGTDTSFQLAPLASFTLLAASLVSAHTRPSFLPERRLASNAAAAPSHDNNSYACSVGNAYCCNTAISDKASKKTVSNLAGLDDIEGMVALQCSSIPVLAGGEQNHS